MRSWFFSVFKSELVEISSRATEIAFRRSAGPFRRSETARKPRRGESQGWDEQPECMVKYMRIPSTAGTRDPERSRFFHKLSVVWVENDGSGAAPDFPGLG